MFEKLQAFNAQYNGLPVKVGAAVIGALVVGGLAVAAYNTFASPTLIIEGEIIADVVEATADALD